MNSMLKELFPNSIYYYNTLLDTFYSDTEQLSKEEGLFIVKKLKENGIFFKIDIDTKKYTLDVKSEGNGYKICKQTNLYKNTEMDIIIYENLMVLDYDNIEYTEIVDILLKNSTETFDIYKTHNGYHAYCMSNKYSRRNFKTLQIMNNLKCDQIYISFCYEYGFCVRLTKKPDRDEEYVEKFVATVGNAKRLIELVSLVKTKDLYLSI